LDIAGDPIREVLMSFLAALWGHLRTRKKFWLPPIIIMVVVVGGLFVADKVAVLAPRIYGLF
jgi:hypothetical protein